MSCDLTEKISLLIDGELAPIESRAVERHLLECAECQQVRADFLSLRSQVEAYTSALIPAAPRRQLARVLSPRVPASTRGAERERLPGVFGGRRLSPALATVVATLLLGCAIAATVYFRSQRGAGVASPPQGTVAKEQPGVSPASVPPLPKTADPGSPNSKKAEAVVRSVEPKRRNSQRGGTATAGEQTNASARLPRIRRESRTPAPHGNSAAPDNVALNASYAATASSAPIRPADTETLTAQHLEQSELLLRAFRNLRPGSQVGRDDLGYERRRAQQLFYQNVLLRREADTAGDVQVATLLESLEPILLDIANLSDRPPGDEVQAIKERVERQNLVALLQINSTSLARAFE